MNKIIDTSKIAKLSIMLVFYSFKSIFAKNFTKTFRQIVDKVEKELCRLEMKKKKDLKLTDTPNHVYNKIKRSFQEWKTF